METRIAAISIIVTEPSSVERLNSILHDYRDYIIGRMGIPYREKNIFVISIAMDAPVNEINALTGKIGRLDGIHAKAACV
ncbi:MAG: iron-only hydrogenase system regulator [Firmicutes bacterium]|jgi:putative iron-only hydrogenase system regulator|nr:iron-only hydrogenase system regulator [Bacillota bacterium]